MIILQNIDISRVFLAVLLNFVWQATLIAALMFFVKAVIGPSLIRIQYGLSVVGLFSLIAFPVLSFGYFIIEYDQLPALSISVDGLISSTQSGLAPQTIQYAPIEQLFLWFDSSRNIWLTVWMIGAFVLTARTTIGLVACHQVRKHTIPIPPAVHRVVSRIQNNLNIGVNVTVVASARIGQAVATGILKPMVLLPASWITEMPIASLEAVIAHELAHIKRYDLWFVAIQRCVETIFFFHPATWWISRRLTQEREACCDRLAVQATGNKLQYAETLAMIAEANQLNHPSLSFSSAFSGGQQMNLLRRITLILEPTRSSYRTPMRPFVSIACLSLMVAFGSYSYNLSASPIGSVRENAQDEDDDQDEKKSNKIKVVNRIKKVEKKGHAKGVYRIHLTVKDVKDVKKGEGVYELHLTSDDSDAKDNIEVHNLHKLEELHELHNELQTLHHKKGDAKHAAHGVHKLQIDVDQDGESSGVWVVADEGGKVSLKTLEALLGDASRDGLVGNPRRVSLKTLEALLGDHRGGDHHGIAIVSDSFSHQGKDGKPHVIRLNVDHDGNVEKHSGEGHSWHGDKHHDTNGKPHGMVWRVKGNDDTDEDIEIELTREYVVVPFRDRDGNAIREFHVDGGKVFILDDGKKITKEKILKRGENTFFFSDDDGGGKAKGKLFKKGENTIFLHRTDEDSNDEDIEIEIHEAHGDPAVHGRKGKLKKVERIHVNDLTTKGVITKRNVLKHQEKIILKKGNVKKNMAFFYDNDGDAKNVKKDVQIEVVGKKNASTKAAIAEVLAELKELRREVNELKKEAKSGGGK